MPDVVAYVALGANLEDPVAQVRRGIAELGRLPDSWLVACSALYRSKPVDYVEQPDFINAVAGLRTRLGPRALMSALLDIEARHGRDRTFKNAPRTLDLDLLLYDALVMHEPGLTLPHPRMAARAFVLLPLAEIAPEVRVPGCGRAADCLAGLSLAGVERLPADALPAMR